MKTLYLERSTGEVRQGDWVDKLDLDGVERIVVGIGPGSFAGIRSALAFAQGYQLGKPQVEVYGLPSPCAIAATIGGKVAVLGDARQGKIWVALFDGFCLLREIFQVDGGADPVQVLRAAVPEGFSVVTPDERRIGSLLRQAFGERHLGERLPTSDGLRTFAEACPKILKAEPLPIYLNPAVRT